MDAAQHTMNWTEMFLQRLPYPYRVLQWSGWGENVLKDWTRLGFDVEILRVTRLDTRKPGFHDYDLAAIVRARSATMVRGTGCDGDVVVDAQIGLHLSNAGLVHPWMWYGKHVAVVTLRCHEGHRNHFRSWRLPDAQAKAGINQLILGAISRQFRVSRSCDSNDPVYRAYDILMSRLLLW